MAVDTKLKYLLVAYEKGLVQVNNLYSGALIYNEAEPMRIENEVANLRFFSDNCNYWFITTCWDGKIAFFSKSLTKKGRN